MGTSEYLRKKYFTAQFSQPQHQVATKAASNSAVAQEVKLLLAILASHIVPLVWEPAALFPIQLPAHAAEKTAENGSSTLSLCYS